MKNVVFLGDLKRVVSPAIGQTGLRDLITRAEASGEVTEDSLTVSIGWEVVSVKGTYDPNSQTLTVEGYAR